MSVIRLKGQADRRLRAGHQWIYSNEVDTNKTPLKQFTPGDQVVVETAQGKPLGIAMVNPNTLICGRLVSRSVDTVLNKSTLVHRIKIALSLREMVYPGPYYRLVFGDSDGLSGLVVDRFADILVIQISTAGMERLKNEIVEALQEVIKPSAILLKNDGKMRQIEGLETYVEEAFGTVPELVFLQENDVLFQAPVWDGQKTGWFYDHRENRKTMQGFCDGKRVLDVFSYVGGWGVQATAAGATDVTFIDASESALSHVDENLKLNQYEGDANLMHGDAFDAMQSLIDDKARFDVVVMDPPAFIARRKDIKAGEGAYHRANQLAMRLVAKGGVLVTGSCSMHLETNRLHDIVRSNSRQLERFSQLIYRGTQAPDHPVHPAIEETEYLKALFYRIHNNMGL
ncbi:Ribosomal RNA large subunit methyltransferase I [Marinomonas spartinae]|uniref:Ribosomal RNA large subunit methyltransferase I n=1 Tax=Marinomonas spartinae TaxID=1792290 RepID=A0A1A8TSJ8_9GAMM|nr:class I SAM-dependent rRNA methyltransferase [Marinomonas spartinae]SBS36581.1 Ribosomal RNA large subunit methyltransferase I [Marinomonas spartinae]